MSAKRIQKSDQCLQHHSTEPKCAKKIGQFSPFVTCLQGQTWQLQLHSVFRRFVVSSLRRSFQYVHIDSTVKECLFQKICLYPTCHMSIIWHVYWHICWRFNFNCDMFRHVFRHMLFPSISCNILSHSSSAGVGIRPRYVRAQVRQEEENVMSPCHPHKPGDSPAQYEEQLWEKNSCPRIFPKTIYIHVVLVVV